MSRIFLSHASQDSSEAVALKRWLIDQDPSLENEIFEQTRSSRHGSTPRRV
jgi:hypothetical protein